MGGNDAAMGSHMNLLVKCALRRLEHDLIDITPAPIFTGLEGLDNGMAARMEMFGSVLVFRRVTAANMPANKAFAQVYPRVTNFQAILAAISTGRDIPDLIEMRTILCHLFFPFFSLIDALHSGLTLQ